MFEKISARDIAASGLKAQRTRMNIIASNIANAQALRTGKTGEPFRRQMVILRGEELTVGNFIPRPCALCGLSRPPEQIRLRRLSAIKQCQGTLTPTIAGDVLGGPLAGPGA